MLIRTADLSDLRDIFEWRNDFFSRSMFLNSEVVSLNDHIDWYHRYLKNPHKIIYIGSINELKAGVVYFDEDTKQSKVSINLNPLLRGKGFGFLLLSKSISVYKQIKDTPLIATVKKENYPSIRIFTKCGFHIKSEDDLCYHLIRG